MAAVAGLADAPAGHFISGKLFSLDAIRRRRLTREAGNVCGHTRPASTPGCVHLYTHVCTCAHQPLCLCPAVRESLDITPHQDVCFVIIYEAPNTSSQVWLTKLTTN